MVLARDSLSVHLGAAIVELACQAGHQVVFTGRNAQLLEGSRRQLLGPVEHRSAALR
jgi:NAD(P)-dependent dehydrogenase (short-subunit alcohol dehydrogenase family)